MKTEEISNECRETVEEICLKYGYDDKDKEGNDSLKTVLLKAIPIMLKDSNEEDRKLFYQMIRHTPIIVTQNLTQESYEKIYEQYIGKDVNKHIIEEDNSELDEYNSELGAGAYVSEAVFDENMNFQGKKSFIYIQKVDGQAKDFFGSDINVSHLIHELGHAWHAEKDQFTIQEDGTLKERVGTAEFIYSFSKTQDNKFIKRCEKTTGLMIEESMNTNAEEVAMANYMGLSLEDMKKEYKSVLIPSKYQGYMADFVSYMLECIGKSDFENYRLYGKEESKNNINSLMEKTEYWINREKDILPSNESPRSYDKKRAVIDSIDNTRVQDFFKRYETTYFPDISKMTPIEKIDNVLEQYFDLNMTKYNMGIDNYRDFLERLGYEGYSLINQASDLVNSKDQEELSSTAEIQKEITPSQVARNALKTTTTDKANEAMNVEISERNIVHEKEGETRND